MLFNANLNCWQKMWHIEEENVVKILCHQIFLILTFSVSHSLLSAVFDTALILSQKSNFVPNESFLKGKLFAIKTNSRVCACVHQIVSYTTLANLTPIEDHFYLSWYAWVVTYIKSAHFFSFLRVSFKK